MVLESREDLDQAPNALFYPEVNLSVCAVHKALGLTPQNRIKKIKE